MIDKKTFMLCESIDEQGLEHLDREKWKANIKYDGERVIAVKQGTDIFLVNRRGRIINEQFKEVLTDLKESQHDFIIDGEIISYDNNFIKLQRRALTKDREKREQLEKEIPCKYMLFDILVIDGKNIMQEKLKDRLVYLNKLINDFGENVELIIYDDINNLYAQAIDNCYEGIIVKDMDSTYENRRSQSWKKRKLFKEGYLIINAYTTNPKGIRATDKDENAVQIAGRQAQEVKEMIDKQGYAEICIQYLEKTKDERYRFISYRGLK